MCLSFAEDGGGMPRALIGGADMTTHGRGAVRAKENSQLLIKCLDAAGKGFIERTEVYDISRTGISFYLQNQVWVDAHLTIAIASTSLFGRLHTTSAKVVRIQTDCSGRRLVAACFDE